MQNEWKPTKRLCTNCGQLIVGYSNEKGFVKLQCPKCGLVMVSKKNEQTSRADRYYASARRIH